MKFTKKEIKENCTSEVYRMGEVLCDRGMVKHIELEEGEDYIDLFGLVEESCSIAYEAEANIDTIEDEGYVYDYHCNCPTYYDRIGQTNVVTVMNLPLQCIESRVA